MEAGEGSDRGIYRNHPEWNMTIYYVVHDYNTLERTGFMVITIPLKNINKLLDTSYEGTWPVSYTHLGRKSLKSFYPGCGMKNLGFTATIKQMSRNSAWYYPPAIFMR